MINIFTNSLETSERNKKEELKTHYYKASFQNILKAFNKIAEDEWMEVHEYNETYGEIYLVGDGYECIVTVTEISRYESGVDFKINYFSVLGFGRPHKLAVKLYDLLDKELPFKGKELHINGWEN